MRQWKWQVLQSEKPSEGQAPQSACKPADQKVQQKSKSISVPRSPPLLSDPTLLRQVLEPRRRGQIGGQVQSKGCFV